MKIFLAIVFLLASATLPAIAVPSLIQGRVFDKKTGANVVAHITFINMTSKEEIASSRSNSATGKYTAVIPVEKSLTIRLVVECAGYPRTELTVKFLYTGEYQEINLDIPVGVTAPARMPATPKSKPSKRFK